LNSNKFLGENPKDTSIRHHDFEFEKKALYGKDDEKLDLCYVVNGKNFYSSKKVLAKHSMYFESLTLPKRKVK
jgi:hypothetical protein